MVTFMVTYGDVYGEKSTWVIAKKVNIEEFFFFLIIDEIWRHPSTTWKEIVNT